MKFCKRFAVMFSLMAAAGFFRLAAAMTPEAEEIKNAVLKELRSGTSANPYSNVFNPAMGVVLDATFRNTTNEESGFQFRSAELNLEAAVDPFLRATFIINGTDEGLEVEEAAVVITRLPRGLQLRAGRYFANFGRLPKFHDHELPFVERTPSLDTFIDGEAKADGVELTYLAPLPFYLQATLGATNKIGAENTRLEEDQALNPGGTGNTEGRRGEAFTYNGRLFTYVPIGDKNGLDIGVSEAYTPAAQFVGGIRNDRGRSERVLAGADVTYRYEPGTLGFIRKVTWGTEVFANTERRRQVNAIDSDNDGASDTDDFQRKSAQGGYSFLDVLFGRRFSGGGFYDVAEDLDDPDNVKKKTYGGVLNFLPSEFQRIRVQLSKQTDSVGTRVNNQFFVQWVAAIGRHAHTFKDR